MKNIKLTLLLFLILLFSLFALADETGEEHDESVDQRAVVGTSLNSWQAVNPFFYFNQGQLGYGILMMASWLVLIGGCIVLILMVLSRMVVVKK